MSLRHALLGALADRPRTGYALWKHFEQSLAYAWPARHSQIYPELARLLDEGLIEQIGSGPRRSRTYAVTAAGIAEVKRWLREAEPARATRDEASLRIFLLWLLEPAERRRFLDEELQIHRAMLTEYELIRDSNEWVRPKERTFRIALELGIRRRRAAVRWAEWALQYLDEQPDRTPPRPRRAVQRRRSKR
jgi:PadR family transcriptional regulator AphA